MAAINCDDEANKSFCGRMGVQGFPTLKIVIPGKKPGRPRVEDYQGPRTAKAIVDTVVDRIPNHVKRLTADSVDDWLAQDGQSPKLVLFTEKGTTSALLRALAIDFLGQVKVGQLRSKEAAAVEKFGIDTFPTLVLFPGGDREHVVFTGDLKKGQITEFLRQVALPNPDAARTSTSTSSSAASKGGDEHASPPSESPSEKASPVEAAPISVLSTAEALESSCLVASSGTCVLAMLPAPAGSDAELPASATEALSSLAEIAHRYAQRKSKLFPFYAVPAANPGNKILRQSLELSAAESSEVDIVAVNGRKGWWRRFPSSDSAEHAYGLEAVEAWIDAIRLGEGSKQKLPDGLIVAATDREIDHDEL